MNIEQADVAIVGAGPSGSASAIALARMGYSVIVFDKRAFPRDKLCGDFLNPVSWPLLEELGVAGEIVALAHEDVRAFRLSTFVGAQARLPLPHGTRWGLGIRRFYLDHLLVGKALQGGARIKQGWKIKGLKRDRGRWWIKASDSGSREAKVCAPVLIGADGRNSWVAHRLGLARTCEGGGFTAFQLLLRGAKVPCDEVQIHVFPGGYAGLVGVGEGLLNLCFSVEKQKLKGHSVELLLNCDLYQNPYLREALSDCRLEAPVRSAYPVYFPPRLLYGDGFVLVGDAARVTEPVTGEGIYFALKSGVLAAETIDKALRKGNFSAEELSDYMRAAGSAFSRRERLNRLVRAVIYRPRLLGSLVRFSAGTSFPLEPILHALCAPPESG